MTFFRISRQKRLIVLFFREEKAPARSLVVIRPLIEFAKTIGWKCEIWGGLSAIDDQLKAEISRIGIVYKTNFLLRGKSFARIFALAPLTYILALYLAATSAGVVTISNSWQTRIFGRACLWAGKRLLMIQWAVAAFKQTEFDLLKPPAIPPYSITQSLKKILHYILIGKVPLSYMDLPHSLACFWCPSQREHFADQVSSNVKFANFYVPHIDELRRLGRSGSSQSSRLLYVFGHSSDHEDTDQKLFENAFTIEQHLKILKNIFDLLRSKYGYSEFWVKLRPTPKDIEAFQRQNWEYPGLVVKQYQPTLELMKDADLVITDYLSSATYEASIMGKKTIYLDFAKENPLIRASAINYIRNSGAQIIRPESAESDLGNPQMGKLVLETFDDNCLRLIRFLDPGPSKTR